MRPVVAALALLLSACGGNTQMSTEGYDQTCEIANTCRVVFVGDVCGCPCQVDAINYTEEIRWAQERGRKQGRCDDLLACQPCPQVFLECNAGTCEASIDGGVDNGVENGENGGE